MAINTCTLTLSHPEALHWQVKSSGIRQSKLAGLGEERLIIINNTVQMLPAIQCCIQVYCILLAQHLITIYIVSTVHTNAHTNAVYYYNIPVMTILGCISHSLQVSFLCIK